jgi:hypothetical protein
MFGPVDGRAGAEVCDARLPGSDVKPTSKNRNKRWEVKKWKGFLGVY